MGLAPELTEAEFASFRRFILVWAALWGAVLVGVVVAFARLEGSWGFVAIGLLVLFPGVANIRIALMAAPEGRRALVLRQVRPTPTRGHGLSLFSTCLAAIFFGVPGIVALAIFAIEPAWQLFLAGLCSVGFAGAIVWGYVARKRERELVVDERSPSGADQNGPAPKSKLVEAIERGMGFLLAASFVYLWHLTQRNGYLVAALGAIVLAPTFFWGSRVSGGERRKLAIVLVVVGLILIVAGLVLSKDRAF